MTGILGLVFTACDPLEDTMDEIGDITPVIQGTTDYTLTAEDYEALLLEDEYFTSVEEAEALIPAFLEDLYPTKGAGAIANVTFDVNIGYALSSYALTLDDYLGLRSGDAEYEEENIEGFEQLIAEEDALAYVNELVATNHTDAEDGEVVLATYSYFEKADVENYYFADFSIEEDFNSFESKNETGEDQEWEYSDFRGDFYAEMNGFDNGENENKDWLISPAIDLSGVSDAGLTISQTLNFKDVAEGNNVYIATDYNTGDDNYSAANWIKIKFATVPEGNSYDIITSEELDLTKVEIEGSDQTIDFSNQVIHIAFVYDYPEGDTALWRLFDVTIKPFGVTTETQYDLYGVFYSYSEESSEWEAIDDQFYISDAADYDAMGEGSGQPGQYDNFSSSVSSSDYVPTFLATKYPFAFEEDQMYVAYKYYSSSAGGLQVRGDLFTLTDGAWVEYDNVVTETIQFGKEADGWVPDNTILYTLTTDDYSFAAAELLEEVGFEAAAGNLDNFGNFNRNGGTTNWSDEMLVTAFGLILDKNDPAAEVGQKYLITFAMYNGSSGTEELKVIKDADGAWILN